MRSPLGLRTYRKARQFAWSVGARMRCSFPSPAKPMLRVWCERIERTHEAVEQCGEADDQPQIVGCSPLTAVLDRRRGDVLRCVPIICLHLHSRSGTAGLPARRTTAAGSWLQTPAHGTRASACDDLHHGSMALASQVPIAKGAVQQRVGTDKAGWCAPPSRGNRWSPALPLNAVLDAP